MIINLVTINKVYTITGELIQGQMEYASGLNETYTNVKDKWNLIEDIIESGHTVTLTIDGVDHTGLIQKWHDDIENRDLQSTPNDGDAAFPCTLAFICGVDRMKQTS